MIDDRVKEVLERASGWPLERQQELAEAALEIEAELAGREYEASPDELAAIDEGTDGQSASDEEIAEALASFDRE